MFLRNDFPLKIRNLYLGHWRCFLCGANGWGRGGLEIHHVLGRKSSSAFNSSCLCGDCHRHIGHTREEHKRIFIETARFLKGINYRPTDDDYAFLRENYEEIISKEVIDWLKEK